MSHNPPLAPGVVRTGRDDSAVMTTLKNLAKRARQGVTEDNPDEMENIQ